MIKMFATSGLALAGALFVAVSAAPAATVTFWDDGKDNFAASSGERFDVTCWTDSTRTTMADCSGALIDLGANLFDTAAGNGLNGDMTTSTGGNPAAELAFVQGYVGDPSLDFLVPGDGDASKSTGVGASGSFSLTSLYTLLVIGTEPRWGLLRNDSGSSIFVDFLQVDGVGAGLSHYTQFGIVPLPAAVTLLLAGLGWFGFLGWRRRRHMTAA